MSANASVRIVVGPVTAVDNGRAADAAVAALASADVERTIPFVDQAIRASDPSIIYAAPYRALLYDAAAVRGAGFDVAGIVGDPSVPFAYFGERTLCLHNLGHALTSYLGERAGAACIHEYEPR